MPTKPRYVATICSCGCSKLKIPPHLRDADLWVAVTPQPGQTEVQFSYQHTWISDGPWKKL